MDDLRFCLHNSPGSSGVPGAVTEVVHTFVIRANISPTAENPSHSREQESLLFS
jgi:hypothetical protein